LKQRHRRKQIQYKTKRSKAFLWGVDKVMRVTVTASNKMSAALAKVYAESRERMRQEKEKQ